ncbi:MAG TPA: hypothetical protein VGF59_16790 [Bryobacteraceae bacterium]|jgi:hypothetical protein
MEETIVTPVDGFDLGEILGRRRAFSRIAGQCSASDVACMRRIREEKLYLQRAGTWEEFCPKYLGITKQHANRTIRLLDEFGPGYFELAALTQMSPDEFRRLAPPVMDGALTVRGEAIALLAENTDRINQAIADLRAAAAERRPAGRLDALDKRRQDIVRRFRKIAESTQNEEERMRLIRAVRGTVVELKKIESDLAK